MKLKEFLSLISDEDIMVELEIDGIQEQEYLCTCFWLSDFRADLSGKEKYGEYIIESISFITQTLQADISICIKKQN